MIKQSQGEGTTHQSFRRGVLLNPCREKTPGDQMGLILRVLLFLWLLRNISPLQARKLRLSFAHLYFRLVRAKT